LYFSFIGSLAPGICLITISIPTLLTSSYAVSRSALALRANPNSSIAASVLGIANKAVSIFLGAGNNFNTAEVIIPRVPSLPINSCFKSYPLLSFLKLVKLLHISPLA